MDYEAAWNNLEEIVSDACNEGLQRKYNELDSENDVMSAKFWVYERIHHLMLNNEEEEI